MLLIIHVVLAFIAITAAADICYEFSALERYNPASTCGSAVDYQFYLNSNTTLAALDYAARVLLSDQKFALSSTQCLKNYKKLVCSNIYSKCESGLMFSDKATYNHIIFPNYPVPFTRPCKNVCTNVVDSCYGLFKPNCSELFDYSFGNYHITSKLPTRYDPSNNPGLCNVVPSVFTVAATSEPYLYQESGACSGLVTDVYIPPGYILDASLPYLSPQYEIQSITESKLVDAFSQIPVYIDSDCHFAFRKYFCGMYMLQPEALSVSAAIAATLGRLGVRESMLNINASFLESTIYIPSFPSFDVCIDYETKCATFLLLANVSSLFPKCSSTIPPYGIKKFPSTPQVVNVVGLPLVFKNTSILSTTAEIYLVSDSNDFSNANDRGFTTQCPKGFVVPENPSDPRTGMIPGSGCAFACRFPIWTIHEYKTFDVLVTVLSAFGLPMVLYFVIGSLMDRQKRRTQYLRIIYASTALVLAIWVLALAHNPAKYFCKDNAIAYNSIYDGATACTTQAVFFFYGGLINGVAWMCLSLDLFFKIVLGFKSTTHHLPYHIVYVYVLPAIWTLAVVGSKTEFGYLDSSSAICSISSHGYKDVYFFYIPMFIFNAVGLLAGISVIVTIIRSINDTSSTHGGCWNRFLVLRTPLFFLLMFVTLWAAAFAFRITIYFNKEVIFASIFDWTVCVFKNFNGSDAGWQDVCGVAPRERPSYTFNMFILTFIAGQGIIITLIFKGSQIFDSIKKTVTLTRQLSKRKIYATAVSTSHTAIPINFESTVKIMDRMERDSPEISVRMNPEQQDFFRKKSILDRESRSQNYRT